MPQANRPQFRNIHITDIVRYRLPLAGIVSILHRISGLFIFAMLPFLLYLLDNSLTSEDTFMYFKGFVSYPLVKIILLGLIWAYLHHFCAGIRHLAMDVHMGLDKHSAKNSAAGVFVVSIVLAALFGLKLFGVF
jgi:succinate dehydrogenase / fumarate reductase, cytochrome b subunit